jgi:hypothetical protein
MSVHHKPSHYDALIKIEGDHWFSFDDATVKAATCELEGGNVSFDSSHLRGVTTVVYELQQGDESDGGDPVGPEMVTHRDNYQHEYQEECTNWMLDSQRLAPVAVQVLEVVMSEGCRGEGGGRRMRRNSSGWC